MLLLIGVQSDNVAFHFSFFLLHVVAVHCTSLHSVASHYLLVTIFSYVKAIYVNGSKMGARIWAKQALLIPFNAKLKKEKTPERGV